jgi:hypothetical protein
MANNNDWSVDSYKLINNCKKSILKKKIKLSFIINNYSFKDKLFKYVHIILAVATPVFALIEEVSEQVQGSTLVLSLLVASMIKLRSHLRYSKMHSVAKEQTVKYKQLYDRIEGELIKPINKRQAEEDFIYWISREYNNIEMADPELSSADREAFKKLCIEKKIPYDEDIQILHVLIGDQSSISISTRKDSENINVSEDLKWVMSRLETIN